MTRAAFLNAIRVNSAIGGSTNAPIHLNAIARHLGVELAIEDWQEYGEDIPLLVNLQPAGEYLGEDYYHAGGVPAVFGQLIAQGLIDESVMTVSGRTVGECYRGAVITDENVIRPFDRPLKERAGFRVLTGNIFHSAVMKMSVVSPEFRERYLSDPAHPNAFEGRAVVFDGPEDYHHRIDDPSLGIDENTLLFMRGAGPKGYPGAAEVVNMRAPDYLLKRGVTSLVCIGDGRQSGTSGSPSILNASPEAASNGRAGAGRDRRPGAARPQRRAARPPGRRRRAGASGAPRSRRPAATATPSTRRPGRRSSAASSASSRPARCWSRRSSTSASPRRRDCRATTTSRRMARRAWCLLPRRLSGWRPRRRTASGCRRRR